MTTRAAAALRRLVDFYAIQLRLIWEWRGGPLALIKRGIITLVVAAVSFAITAWLLAGMSIRSPLDAIVAVILIGLFNALVRPLVLAVVAPWSLIATGIAVLVLQVLVFLLLVRVSPGIHVADPLTAVVASFVYAIVNSALTAILAVDRGGSYYGYLLQALRARGAAPPTDRPGVVIFQIDGLAHPILAARIRAGSVNTMAGWVRAGSHRLSRWEALLPSMTSAGQLGILHGTNDGIPAFRWFERDRQRLMVSSKPADAAEIVRRASDGEGLLSNDGVSICNLVTGDATRSYVTTAALAEGTGGLGDSRVFSRVFYNPSGYLRALTMFLGELITERVQNRRARRAGVQPRLDRGMKYAAMRAASNVLLRDVNVSLIIEEMYRGANVIYADFTDYDEIAHHSGPERLEALQALDGIDAAFATIVKAADDAPRPYRFVVLSDHGQSLGATFEQRYGESLGELVQRLAGAGAVAEQETVAEGAAFTNTYLSELVRGDGATSSIARLAFSGRTTDGMVDVDTTPETDRPTEVASTVVVGSGNLGLVYFTGFDHRLTLEELEDLHPQLVGRLATHPGVSMILVCSSENGGLVIGPRGVRFLADGRITGDDPLEPFGPNALASLRREDEMEHAPDILLISEYHPELGEVAAFEELIGSHGGLGGMQVEPFILHPTDWELDEPVPVGSPAIYRNLRRWLESIDITVGPTRDRPAAEEVREPASV